MSRGRQVCINGCIGCVDGDLCIECEEAMNPKQFPTCPSCGSEEINAETPCAVFDIELQRWVAQDGEVDNFFCNACQMEFGKPVWQNIEKGDER